MTHQQRIRNHPLWGELPGGSHNVGFKTYFKYDYARVYNLPLGGNLNTSSAKQHRPILINIWYPAQRDDSASVMSYREYFAIGQNDDDLGDFCEQLIAFNLNVISKELMYKSYKDLSNEERAILENFLDTKTAATQDAAPSVGRFPLVINHQGLGGSFEDNSVLFEFLASHGYVVATSAYQPEDSEFFNIDWDLVRSIKDMDFLLNTLHDHPNMDQQKVASMGHSYGAQAAMAWASEKNSPIDAVISIDSTFESYGDEGYEKLKERLARVDNLSAPMLFFASTWEKPHFGYYASLKYAKRYYAQIDHLSHNDYVLHGAIGSGLRLASHPDPDPEFAVPEPKLTRESYELVCCYILKFLDAYLKDDQSALEFLHNRDRGVGVNVDRLSLQFEDAVPLLSSF